VALLYTIVIGFVVGVLARFIYPGPQPMGWIMTILLGVGGSLVAGWGGQALGLYEHGQAAGFIASVIGAIILLFVYQRVIAKS